MCDPKSRETCFYSGSATRTNVSFFDTAVRASRPHFLLPIAEARRAWPRKRETIFADFGTHILWSWIWEALATKCIRLGFQVRRGEAFIGIVPRWTKSYVSGFGKSRVRYGRTEEERKRRCFRKWKCGESYKLDVEPRTFSMSNVALAVRAH